MSKVKMWTMPENYSGETWDGWFVAPVGRSRDSDTVEESNFRVTLDRLTHGNDDGDTVVVVRERHFLVGWVEWIAIDPKDTFAMTEAEMIATELEDYPILDDDDHSELEWERESAE